MRLIDETAYQDKLAKIPMGERFFVKAVETAQHMPTIDPVKHGEWVPVCEKLPDDSASGLNFMVMTSATGHSNGVLSMEYEVAIIRNKTVRRWKWYGGRLSPWKVTHWMPRPEPPRMDGEA